LSLRIDLDLRQVGELLMDAGIPGVRGADKKRRLSVSAVDQSMLDAVTRQPARLDSPWTLRSWHQ
jgi:hypothetical protein